MSSMFLFLTLLTYALADTGYEEQKIVQFFKCREAGNFSHPDKCGSLVHCNSELIAYEIECPVCTDLEHCPEGRLHYNSERGYCDTPDLAQCPPRGECDVTCMQEGYCDCFDTCLPDNSSSSGGRWSRGHRCDIDLFWNPDAAGIHHGGTCDFWDNLSPVQQEIYRLDPVCVTPQLECFWAADPDCDNKYFYLPHDSKHINNLQHLTCPVSPEGVPLYWEQDSKSCGHACASRPNCTLCE